MINNECKHDEVSTRLDKFYPHTAHKQANKKLTHHSKTTQIQNLQFVVEC